MDKLINPYYDIAPEFIPPDKVSFLRNFGFQEVGVLTAHFMGWVYYFSSKGFGRFPKRIGWEREYIIGKDFPSKEDKVD